MGYKLTERQAFISEIIDSRLDKGLAAPTIREISKEANISTKAVFDHIEALCKKGAYERDEFKSRSLKWGKNNPKANAKGTFNLNVQENITENMSLFGGKEFVESTATVSLSEVLFDKDKENYTAFMVDDSLMELNGIFKGDIAIIEKTDTLKNGDIIAYETSASPFVLAYYFKEGQRIKLTTQRNGSGGGFVVNVNIKGKLREIRRVYK